MARRSGPLGSRGACRRGPLPQPHGRVPPRRRGGFARPCPWRDCSSAASCKGVSPVPQYQGRELATWLLEPSVSVPFGGINHIALWGSRHPRPLRSAAILQDGHAAPVTGSLATASPRAWPAPFCFLSLQT